MGRVKGRGEAGEERKGRFQCPPGRASRPGWGAAAGTARAALRPPPSASGLRSPPHSAAAGCCERVTSARGGGAPKGAEVGVGRGRSTSPSRPLFCERRGGGAESLSLGHVIVSKRELRGSRRLGDHYKTQPGERVSATAAAAASPAPDGPGRAAAAAARIAEPASAGLSSSRGSKRPSGPQRAPRAPAPPRSLQAPRLQKPPNFPPPATVDSSTLAPPRASGEKGHAGCQEWASFSLPRLSPPGERNSRAD